MRKVFKYILQVFIIIIIRKCFAHQIVYQLLLLISAHFWTSVLSHWTFVFGCWRTTYRHDGLKLQRHLIMANSIQEIFQWQSFMFAQGEYYTHPSLLFHFPRKNREWPIDCILLKKAIQILYYFLIFIGAYKKRHFVHFRGHLEVSEVLWSECSNWS